MSCQLLRCWLFLLSPLGLLLCLPRPLACSASWRGRVGRREGFQTPRWKSPRGSDVTKWAYGREGTSAPGEAADAQQRLVQWIWPGGGSENECNFKLIFTVDIEKVLSSTLGWRALKTPTSATPVSAVKWPRSRFNTSCPDSLGFDWEDLAGCKPGHSGRS